MRQADAHIGQIVRGKYGSFYRITELGVTRYEHYQSGRKDHFMAQPVEQQENDEWKPKQDANGKRRQEVRIAARDCLPYAEWAERQRKAEEARRKREEIQARSEIFKADVIRLMAEKLDVVVGDSQEDCPITVYVNHNTETDDFTVRRVSLDADVMEEIMAGAASCEKCGKSGRDVKLKQHEIDGITVLWCQSCRRKHKAKA